MDIGKKPSDLLFLDREGFYFFAEDQNRSFTFDLRPFVSNLEIVDKAGLKTQIKNFIDTSKIAPTNIVIVLSDNVLFIKGVAPGQSSADEEEKAQIFAESIPFEHIQTKSYAIEGGKLLVGTNKDYYEEISSAFEKSNFSISLILPIYSTGIIIDPTVGFNDVSAKIVLKNLPNLVMFNLEEREIKNKSEEKKPAAPNSQKPDKKRLYALSGFFALLIVVLIFVFINSQKENSPKTKNPASIPANVANVSPTLATQATQSAQLLPQNVRIKLAGPNVNSPSLLAVKKSLENAGYKNITVGLSQAQNPTPLISFSDAISPDAKTQIASIVSQVATNFSTNLEQDPEADVTINLVN